MSTIYNQAQLSYNDTVTNSNTTETELLELLTASKTAVMDDYVAGDDVTYIISIENTGALPFTGLTIEDNLGKYTVGTLTLYPLTYVVDSIKYYINGTLQTVPPLVTPGPPMTISGINVPAGGNVLIVYEVDVNQFAPLAAAAKIDNVALIQGGGLSSDIEVTETIYTEDIPSLTISKCACPQAVVENGQMTYTFIIENFGNTAAVAGDAVTLTDTFSPVLSGITVDFNGVPWTVITDYTYNAVSGEFATVPGHITVPAATYTQDLLVGNWIVTPGVSVLTVTGTV